MNKSLLDMTPAERAARLGCLYGAAKIGPCGKPVAHEHHLCGAHGGQDPPASGSEPTDGRPVTGGTP